MANYKMESNLHCLAWRNKNRSHFEIIASMLEAVSDTSGSRYFLMKHMGSNFSEVTKYLKSLKAMGFIFMDEDDSQVLYRTSKKGREFLKQYYVLLRMLLSSTES